MRMAAGRAASLRHLTLSIIIPVLATLVATPHALSREREKHLSVAAGEKVLLWSGADYGSNCGSAGLPWFKPTSVAALGVVTTEQRQITVPSGQNCEGHTYTGFAIWYKAGPKPGMEVLTFTLEFPRTQGAPDRDDVTATITVR